ncbi:MAG: acetyl-CoA hydrolase/transferase C-terminal domain-containing protein [Candidatus Binatus sp.]|uniref:acetyl-CoA hydrolase/transferase family protein n=1 Tax=Candidatus Binatus sp. TaxID=2811406 RepID=UPI00272005E4|nr:acetyl-CoA hydrolase/transferase C-terminal domain-containing protein [Candidatus Binatus sp.]MDO8432615.1 acetyl-CoA hydrolase/transferase C-terminal domain-containing protein [Candidatus Binatus sp.]
MYETEYKSKLMTPAAAVEMIPSRGNLSMGMAVSEPPAVLAALEKRVKAGQIEELRVYYSHSVTAAAVTILKYEYMDVIKPHPFFPTIVERRLLEQGQKDNRRVVFYMPGNFSAMPRTLREIGIDAFVMMVAPMDKGGFFSCGTNGDYTIPTARIAKKLIVEVNPRMPRVFGDSSVHISEVAAIVENDSPLFALPPRLLTPLDQAISKHIVEMVPDRATLQVGIGGVPAAVCAALHGHKDLGIHSELMMPSLAALIQSGAVTNKYKALNRYKNVYTLAAGDEPFYEFLNNNSSMEARGVDYVNDPNVIGQNDRVISINAFLEVGLGGEVNSEAIQGKQYSAPGGQLDFVRGAQLSKDGKSILAAYSTANKGTISRIVAKIEGPTTDPRTDTQYIVTEYGVACLSGKSTSERAEALIAIAHPNFREELHRAARELGYL